MSQPPADEAAPSAGEQASIAAGGDSPSQSAAGTAAASGTIDFPALVARWESPLLRYAAQFVGHADPEQEDIVQDAFLRLHRQVHEHGPDSVQNIPNWLYRVTHNLAMDLLRRRKIRKAVHHDESAVSPASHGSLRSGVPERTHDEDTPGDLERREACTLAMAELATLPDTRRQALTLKMLDGLTIRQIAQVTNTSIGNVGYRLSQGLAELSRRLKKAGVI